jgi:hypothetical protein
MYYEGDVRDILTFDVLLTVCFAFLTKAA